VDLQYQRVIELSADFIQQRVVAPAVREDYRQLA